MSEPKGSGAGTGLRRLGNDRDAARVLGVGERTFAKLVAEADWLPAPISFGARLRRWDLEQLLEAARAHAPRAAAKAPEPEHLAAARRARAAEPPTLAQGRRARIDAMKGGTQAGA